MTERIVTRPLVWTVRRLGARTILALSLLLIVLGSVALGLAHLIRGLDIGLLFPAAVSGVLLGWVLARSPLPGWLSGVVAFALGVEIALVRTGQLGRPLMTLMGALAEQIWRGLRWPVDGPPDTSLITPALAELERSASTLLNRTRDWLLAVTGGQAAFDPLPTALAWSLILWLAAAWAGWTVHRHHRPLHAIAPAGALLAITLSYTWGDPVLLWTLLAATLLLMVLMGQIARERRWQAAGTDFSPELRLDLAAAALPLSVALLMAALLAPSVSLRPLAESAQRLVVEHLGAGKQVADSMGLEPRAGPGIALGRVRAAGLPNRSLIGSGPELSEQVVMLVYLEGQQRAYEMPPGPADALPPHYWRALTYDDYTGRGWRTGETAKVTYRAGEPITSTTTTHRTLRQTVEAVGNMGGLLYAAGELVTADQDYSVAWRSHHDAFGAEIEASRYRTDSWIPITSEAQLRAAGHDYPAWVKERYLALPPEVPPRVLGLAHDLYSNANTSYDQARAIETYLRAFTYTLDLPAPPPNREVADFFLFDLQQGYCDYYATTMVVLARAGGLPARLVVGYASGTYDSANARYVVTAADAHSWVEIYFPEIGWVEFEPTGGRPPIVRPAETAPAELAQALPPLNPITDRWAVLGKLGLLGTLIGLAVLGSALLVWWKADSWRLRRLPPAAVADKLYQRLYRHGRLLAVPAGAGDTPYEFAEGLTERVAELAQDRQLGETSTSTNQDVHWLTDLYVQGLYSPHKPTTAHRSQAIKTWQRLRRRMWLAWIWQTTRRKNGSEE